MEMPDHVCTNRSCAQFGQAHYGCKCPAPMASGGVLEAFCASDRQHLPECEYHVKMADGGRVAEDHTPETAIARGAEIAKLHAENQARHAEFMTNHEKIMSMSAPKPQNTGLAASHHAIHKGLLSTMKDTGDSSLIDPDQYHKVINDAREHHKTRLREETPRPKSLSGKIGHSLAEGDFDKTSDALQGHPLAGVVGKTHLKKIMEHVGGPMMALESNPKALRGSVDYLHAAMKGADSLDKNVKSLLDPGVKIKPEKQHIESLKSHVDDMVKNPDKMLNSGDLSHYLPEHSSAVAALSATAVNYLNSIKPLNQQGAPLDPVLPPSNVALKDYDRQVAIVQNPLLVLQHAKDGTLLPKDIATLTVVYPHLKDSIVSKLNEQIIDIKQKNENIPYKMRSSLSMILGQPLDGTITQSSMQAIMNSALPKSNKTQPSQVGTKGMTAVAYKASKEVEKQTETPLQARQANRKQG